VTFDVVALPNDDERNIVKRFEQPLGRRRGGLAGGLTWKQTGQRLFLRFQLLPHFVFDQG